MDGLIPAIAAATATPDAAIPLDLVSPLEPFQAQGNLSIRVERLPFGARLSKGRNNGDNSWSLTLADLDDLQYLPPEDLIEPHNLTIRVIRVDSDSASTLMRFDIPIGPAELSPGVGPDAAAIQPGAADQGEATSPETNGTGFDALPAGHAGGQDWLTGQSAAPPVVQAAETAPPLNGHAALPVAQAAEIAPPLNGHAAPPVAQAAETAPPLNGHAAAPQEPTGAGAGPVQEIERPLNEARASWEAEHEGRVAAAVQDAVRKAESDARTQLDQTNEARLAQELERRLGDARASWEAEHQGRVAVAVEDAVRKTEAESRVQLDQTTEVRLALELERRLGEARAAWEAELQGRIAAAAQESVQQAETAASAQVEQLNEARLAQELERRLAEARLSWEAELQGRIAVAVEDAAQKAGAGGQPSEANEAQIAQEVARRLSEARASWEAEHQGRVAAAVADAVQRTESATRAQMDQTNEARLAQELDRRLSEARTSWDAETQGRVAAAVQDAVQRTQADSRIQLEQAQQEWQNGTGRELAEMTARCTQAEVALSEARTQPPAGPGDEHALRGLRDELASAQALIRARETELAEMRHAIDRSGSDMSGRAANAEANLERSRSAWHAEREELLARAEEDTQKRIKQALEKWQHETQAALSKAKQEWLDAEETRLAVAEAQWRENIGIAKSRTPITPMMKRGRRVRFTGRIKRYTVIAACLAATFVFYPRIEPLVVEQWWPQIVAYKAEIEPSLRTATMEFKTWVSDMMKRAEDRRKQPK